MVKRYRDIQLIEKDKEHWLAIACDVSAGIGSLKGDLVKVSPDVAGYYAAAVPIVELLAIGAKPLSAVDTIGVPMAGVGEEVINGVKRAMTEAGIPESCLTGSTEDNIPVETTSIGITMIAELHKEALGKQQPTQGQRLCVVGIPKMGQRFLEEEVLGLRGETLTIAAVKILRSLEGISHMLPVGSKGIQQELSTMEEVCGVTLRVDEGCPLDMTGSAGPGTAMILACDEKTVSVLRDAIQQPVQVIGRVL